ncbi:sensor histidine kinase [Paenibacillus sp. strain BS8-2]
MMMLEKRHWSANSLRNKLISSVLLMTLPVVGMLIYNNFYAIQVVREQVAVSYNDMLSLYMNQIDSGLNDVDAYMNTIAIGTDLLSLSQAETDDDYYSAKIYLFDSIRNKIALYPTVSSFFVYEEKRQDIMDIPSSAKISTEEKDSVKSYIIDLIDERDNTLEKAAKRWQYHQIGQDHYFIDIVESGSAYLGAWIRTDQLITPLRSLKMGKVGEILLANDEGEPITNTSIVNENGVVLRGESESYYLSGSDNKYLIVGSSSLRGNFSLVTLIPDKNILANLPYLQRIIWIITIGAIFFIPVGLFALRRAFLRPLNRLLVAMKKVRGGDWSVQVDMRKTSGEFQLLGDSFNSMMTEIQTLRVNVFEEQLNKQKEELQRLQLQVNPHFFLNALNLICNMAKVKNHELIIQMTVALIRYFRFLFRSNTSFVTIRDELDHTRNYLKIQQLRFPDQLTWSIDVPDYLSDAAIPPLFIQSFVENSIKHAVTLDEPVHITVKIEFLEEEQGSRMRIRIVDTGCGFHPYVLQVLQEGRSVQNNQGEHTGIWNVHRRLKLLYNEEASIHYDNEKDTGGAAVEIVVPTNPAMEAMT